MISPWRVRICQTVEVDARPQQVVSAADDGDQVRVHGQGALELGSDDVVEFATADGEVGVAEGKFLGGGIGGQDACQPIGPPDESIRHRLIGIDHALGEGVTEGDVARPDGHADVRSLVLVQVWVVGFGHGRLQSIGSAP